MMKRLFIILLIGIMAQSAKADTVSDKITFSNFECTHDGHKVYISMDVNLKDVRFTREKELVFVPVISSGSESQDFPEFRITGRYRYYRHLRNKDLSETDRMYRYGKMDMLHYEASVPYARWMDSSKVAVLNKYCGCLCKVENNSRRSELAVVDLTDLVFTPDYFYIVPQEKEVVLEVSGSAFVEFVVNSTDIREDYRNNISELNKITATIDSIKADPDVHIVSLVIKGYASPEGAYSANARLASMRTMALKEYLNVRYAFPASIIKTDCEPEDWSGFARLLSKTSLKHRDDILRLIADDALEPDAKENLIRKRYPEDYHFILTHIYPSLRHSDYRVTYKVKSYTDINEAKHVMKSSPGKLSEHEFYMIAQTYEPSSKEFNEVFDVMARIYPNEATACVNAANVSMQQGDLQNAAKFLDRVGEGAEADFARGNLACLIENAKPYVERDYAQAVKYFEKVESDNNRILAAKASEALHRIMSMRK